MEVGKKELCRGEIQSTGVPDLHGRIPDRTRPDLRGPAKAGGGDAVFGKPECGTNGPS